MSFALVLPLIVAALLSAGMLLLTHPGPRLMQSTWMNRVLDTVLVGVGICGTFGCGYAVMYLVSALFIGLAG